MVKTNRPLPHRTVEFCNTIGGKRTSAKPHSPRWSAPGQRLGVGPGSNRRPTNYDAEFQGANRNIAVKPTSANQRLRPDLSNVLDHPSGLMSAVRLRRAPCADRSFLLGTP